MGDAEANVRKWLADNGQVLELQVAQMLVGRGFPVEQSVSYRDPVEGKAREADVVLDLPDPRGPNRGWRSRRLIVSIECKHTTKGPWVGVVHIADPMRQGMKAGDSMAYGDSNAVFDTLQRSRLLTPNAPCGAIYLAAGQGADRNTAYNATRQALAAARALGRDRLQADHDPATSKKRHHGATLAVVVTTAPLFRAELDVRGELELRPADELDVWTDAQSERRPVTVLTRRGLVSWANRLANGWLLG